MNEQWHGKVNAFERRVCYLKFPGVQSHMNKHQAGQETGKHNDGMNVNNFGH